MIAQRKKIGKVQLLNKTAKLQTDGNLQFENLYIKLLKMIS